VTLYRDETLSQGRAERKTPGSDITDSLCKFADIIAVSGNPIADLGLMRNVKFVMKGGVVSKNELAP